MGLEAAFLSIVLSGLKAAARLKSLYITHLSQEREKKGSGDEGADTASGYLLLLLLLLGISGRALYIASGDVDHRVTND